jgi:hypothetical protein
MSYPLLLGKEVILAFIHLRITSQGQDQLLITHYILIETHTPIVVGDNRAKDA